MLRLPEFHLLAPQSLSEALAMLAADPQNTSVLAGGTDLLPNMKRRQQTPARLLSLRNLTALRHIHVSDGEIRIGGAVRLREIEDHPLLQAEARALTQAVSQIATVHIRGTATIGGNLCLDTRCDYYDQSEPWRKAIGYCKKKDGDICWVATSSPRCLAVSSTDAAPALMALSARVVLSSQNGDRELDLADLYHNDGMAYLTKRPDELLTEIRIPRLPSRKSAYWKLRRRGSFDFPLLSVAAAVQLGSDGKVAQAGLALGAVSSRPFLVTDAAQLLVGQPLSDDRIAQVADAAHALAKPMDHADMSLSYRKTMVKSLTRSALCEVRGDDVTKERLRLMRLIG
ncbi:MAG: xanthine dehydrogenase family protein subunit M [Polyangia bacterium]|jgi:4-hydroxybenzoyl-CoA reductase subunit beta